MSRCLVYPGSGLDPEPTRLCCGSMMGDWFPDQARETRFFCYSAFVAKTLRKAAIFPDRPVQCVLVWTDEPRIMDLPQQMLDAALGA